MIVVVGFMVLAFQTQLTSNLRWGKPYAIEILSSVFLSLNKALQDFNQLAAYDHDHKAASDYIVLGARVAWMVAFMIFYF